jgi:glycosyltransferase involved in cell wall biosynthesis
MISTRLTKLTIIVPVFNEASTVGGVAEKLQSIEIQCPFEVLFINDGSTDNSVNVIQGFIRDWGDSSEVRLISKDKNEGKGSAIKRGLIEATGSHILIFDADDEYDVRDISRLVEPLLSNRAEIVFGSRMTSFGTVHPSIQHLVGNKLMTWSANILFGSVISDMHTCLKLIPIRLLRSFRLTHNGFGLDTEITAEILRSGFRPYEVPISYVGRSKQEGKKIRTLDALVSFWILLRVRTRGRTPYGYRNKELL